MPATGWDCMEGASARGREECLFIQLGGRARFIGRPVSGGQEVSQKETAVQNLDLERLVWKDGVLQGREKKELVNTESEGNRVRKMQLNHSFSERRWYFAGSGNNNGRKFICKCQGHLQKKDTWSYQIIIPLTTRVCMPKLVSCSVHFL